MLPRAILVSACLCALAIALPAVSFASHIYFDADADLVPDTELTVGAGETFVVAVCLSDFTDMTGSFQFDVLYDGALLTLVDYDTYMSEPDEDPGLTGPIQTLAELGPWATSQWTDPVTQETNAYDSGAGLMREFYTAGSLTQTATGDGVLAYLVFEATAVGTTTLDLQMPGGTWFLEDVTEQPTPTDIAVTVIPEPVTLALVLAGTALLARRSAKR
jgi:hypothetical protein